MEPRKGEVEMSLTSSADAMLTEVRTESGAFGGSQFTS